MSEKYDEFVKKEMEKMKMKKINLRKIRDHSQRKSEL